MQSKMSFDSLNSLTYNNGNVLFLNKSSFTSSIIEKSKLPDN